MIRSWAVGGMLAFVAGCGQSQDTGETSSVAADDCRPGAAFAESGIDVRTLKNGHGRAACVGDTLTVHTTGWLHDPGSESGRGEKFWSSYDGPGDKFSFVLGSGRVIQGWDLGLPGMLIGETRELKIPSELAYGVSGRGPIPGDADLVFEIELFAADGPGDNDPQ